LRNFERQKELNCIPYHIMLVSVQLNMRLAI
jgi:hypothetical protein